MSLRMGRDKAFLRLGRGRFITKIAKMAVGVSRDVIVTVGTKRVAAFKEVLPPEVLVVKDSYHVANPIGGILSGLERCKNQYAAVIACDLPLVTAEVISLLYARAEGHSAAVPLWENGDIDPLCAVYNVTSAKEAGLRALGMRKIGPREMLGLQDDVVYVPVSEIRSVDPRLGSLQNINMKSDYRRLLDQVGGP